MNLAAIKQVLKTLQQYKASEILHEYQNFSLRYCDQTETFIIIHSSNQEIEEFKDLETCASVVEKLLRGSSVIVK
jgi:hypothetical protein